ncbi:MAG: Hpt domain-containing protein [Woeseia sp.]
MSATTDKPQMQHGVTTMVRGLNIVSQELTETIRAAHLALEECVDGRGGNAALASCASLLHTVRGALRLTETYGAALLAEEMEAVCTHLARVKESPGRDEGLDALTRAMVQLPAYIERLLSGGRDIALVLLPLLNDLRAVRGKPLLSEGTLLLLNLSPSQQSVDQRERTTSGEDVVRVALRLRPRFQLALLGLIKGGNSPKHLKTLGEVAEKLEHAAVGDELYQLWWVLGGVLESLQNGGLDIAVALKRLLGQADRQIKRLIDNGPEKFHDQSVTDLQNNLLYYVARSRHAGPRVSEIRAAFNLSEMLPGDEQVAHARESLSAPSVKLMSTVGTAIKEDLGRVKDVLDIYVRTGMSKPSELVPQLDLLKKISDTLGVLGLGELRGNVDAEVDRLKSIVREGGDAREQTVLEIASTLLRVEDRLDQQLLRLIAPQGPDEGEAGDESEDAEYKHVAEAVMRECIINLARIKETFAHSMSSNSDSHGVDNVPTLIRGIKAGFMMLQKSRALAVFDRIGELITLALRGDGPARLEQREMDRLADAIVSVEYYMETVKAGRKDPFYMLDNAEACLSVLQNLEARLSEDLQEDTGESAAVTEPPPVPDAASLFNTSVLRTAPVVRTPSAHIDPELLELFIEEAKEEIATINRNLPKWVAAPDDMESLITVRRSFHTLKGSGRMVGAERIGEYCWAIENLLNRLINRTMTRTPPMVEFIDAAAAVVPELVEQLEVGAEPQADVNLFLARANAFAEGDPNAARLNIAEPAADPDAADDDGLEMDPVLLDIFSKETAGHLQAIREFIAACEGHRAPFFVTDKLHRSCHTLHGSANMANVDRGVAVAGALNRYIRRVYDYQIGFGEEGIDALQRAAVAIETIVADINNSDRERADYQDLIDRLAALAAAVEPPESDADDAEERRPDDVRVEPAAEAPDEPELAAYDAEIAAIFSEEAAELLEEADRALATWSKDRSSRQHLEELRRHLHTLKGGARMAGVSAMGNLSHAVETLLTGIDDGRISSSRDVDELLQHSIDELHRMRDSVIAGKSVSPASQLEERIRAVCSGGHAAIKDSGDVPLAGSRDESIATESSEFSAEESDFASMVIVNDEQEAEPVSAFDAGGDEPAEYTSEVPEDAADAARLTSDTGHVATISSEEAEQFIGGNDAFESTDDDGAAEAADLHDERERLAAGEDAAAVHEDETSLSEEPAEAASDDAPEDQVAGYDFMRAPTLHDIVTRDLPVKHEQTTDAVEPPDELPEAPQEISEPQQVMPESEEELAQPPPQEAVPDELGARRQMRLAQEAAEQGRGRHGRGDQRQETARIDAELLEDLLNAAGEISIYHSRLSQQITTIEFHVEELEQTVARLREQLRKLEIETEAEIRHGHQETLTSKDFDPLEMDRYSNIQQLSRALAESASDMTSLKDLLRNTTSEAETLLVQQSRVTAELQDGLMRTRMVPFERHVPRLTRLVRQVAMETSKRAELAVEGASGELDRQVLDKMLPPFEHMVRNAVIHGIESPQQRQAAGKPATGRITVRLHREGAEMVIDVSDDGAGLDVNAIRRKAFERELLRPDSKVSDAEIMQLILTPGFSTAREVTQSAGRGVGMDVVATEVKQLGGSLQISSVIGQGTNFTIRLPFTLAITQALIVRAGDEVYALPLPTVEGVARVANAQLKSMLEKADPVYEYGEQTYHFRHLGMYLGGQAAQLPDDNSHVPVILVRAGDQAIALLTDEMIASQEIVVKSLGPQLSSVRGISGATILGDGRIVLILDINSLVRAGMPIVEVRSAAPTAADQRPLALVVDDSITVRRVMERFLTRNGLRVVTAKDGMDAISVLRDAMPDIILLDIEMPRMDGYEFATHVRNDERVSDVPIIMITSRVGDKHRARAIEIGVNDYLGKPYQDSQLLDAIARLLEDRGVSLG